MSCTVAKHALGHDQDTRPCSSVQRFAEEFKAKQLSLDGLINNAGIFLPEHQITPDGFEVGMHYVSTNAQFLSCMKAEQCLHDVLGCTVQITQKTNHFGLFLLSMLLLGELKKSAPSRMVWVSSPAEALGSINWSDLKCVLDPALACMQVACLLRG